MCRSTRSYQKERPKGPAKLTESTGEKTRSSALQGLACPEELQPAIEARTDGDATAATEAAIKAAATTVAAIKNGALAIPQLQQLKVLKELQLGEEAAAIQDELREMVEAAKAVAEGEAGDSRKYEKAALTVEKRWLVFQAVYWVQGNAPLIQS